MPLDELHYTYLNFIDQMTILYGESKTGKSTIIIDILHHLNNHVDQIIVYAPTDRSNDTYQSGVVPMPCIHYEVNVKTLEDLYERQEALTLVYKRANAPHVIDGLIARINDSRINKVLSDLSAARDKAVSEICKTTEGIIAEQQIAALTDRHNRYVASFKKALIERHKAKLLIGANDDERHAIKYLHLNPRIVVIFDDCTEQLDKIKREPIMQKFAYQGRHQFITTIIAIHTDKNLDPAFKKNAMNCIYTEESCMMAYIDRPSNSFGKEARRAAFEAIKSAFTPLAKFQKLIWVREEKKYYRFTAQKHPNFSFGSPLLWEYCKSIQARGGASESNNKFISNLLK